MLNSGMGTTKRSTLMNKEEKIRCSTELEMR